MRKALRIMALAFGIVCGFGMASPALSSHDDANLPANISNETVMPDLFTGNLTLSVPIKVPPGRNGLQPALALVYRSSNGSGPLGMGWELEIGSIERDPKFGITYSDSDTFLFRNSAGTARLIRLSDGTYRAFVEGEDFLKFERIGEGWKATDKNGKKYYFGQIADTRLDNQDNAAQIYKWCLDKIEDTHGNMISISYIKETDFGLGQASGRQIYVGQIIYGITTIVFNYNGEPNFASIDFKPNFRIRTALQLISIAIYSDNIPQRAYQIGYGKTSDKSTPIITSIQEYNKYFTINSYSGNVVPQQYSEKLTKTFEYKINDNFLDSTGYGPAIEMNYNMNYDDIYLSLARIKEGDFNGDGKVDLLRVNGNPNSNTNSTIYFSHGGSWGEKLDGPSFYVGSTAAAAQFDLQRIKFGDFNGDGKTDILRIDGWNTSSGPSTVLLAEGENDQITFSEHPGPGFKVGGDIITASVDLARIRTGDFDGDGKTDIFEIRGSGSSTYETVVHISDGSGFPWTFSGPDFYVNSDVNGAKVDLARIRIADFNGDGKADILRIEGWGSTASSKIYFSTGNSFSPPIDGPSFYVGGSVDAATVDLSRIFLADFNGDGKVDILEVRGWGSPDVPSSVHLSTGSSFDRIDGPSLHVSDSVTWANVDLARIKLGDFNNDGKIDILRVNGANMANEASTIHIFNGYSFWSLPGPEFWVHSDPSFAIGDMSRIRLNNFYGDWNSDVLYIAHSDGTYEPFIYFNNNDSLFEPYDRIKEARNEIGGTFKFSYSFSGLPLFHPVISAINLDDGNGLIKESTYDFQDGYFHFKTRDFRGFKKTTVEEDAPDGHFKITETFFHQGNGDTENKNVNEGFMSGKPYRITISDYLGNIYTEENIEYWHDLDASASYFNPVKVNTTSIFDRDSTSKSIKSEYYYDPAHNITGEVYHGDLSTSDDDYFLMREFACGASGNICRPIYDRKYKGIVNEVKLENETLYFYDGTNNDCSGIPQTDQYLREKGDLTRIVRKLWMPDGTQLPAPEIWMNYYSNGNRQCTRDGRGNKTRIEYDGTTSTFPVREINAKNQTTEITYYGVGTAQDNGLYGQEKSRKDPNNAVINKEYDGFGRLKKVYDTTTSNFPYGTTAYEYIGIGEVGYQRVLERTLNNAETQQYASKENYFDGLGRDIKILTTGPEGKTIRINQKYNKSGMLSEKTLPYFQINATLPQGTVNTYYDVIGRITGVIYPDFSRSVVCYNDLVTVQIDQNGHRKRTISDAYGRTIKVQEYEGNFSPYQCTTDEVALDTGGQQRMPYSTTTYGYDVLGNLVSVQDAYGNTTTILYDSLGRKVEMTDPDMGRWIYRYWDNDLLKSQTDAKNQTVNFDYDQLNRLILKDYPSGTDIVYTYDETSGHGSAIGRLTSITDPSGRTDYFYSDPYVRRVGKTQTVDGVAYTTETEKDVHGRIRSVTYPAPAGTTPETVLYSYDDAGNLRQVGGYLSLDGYNAAGQPHSESYANGIKTSYYYDNISRLSYLYTYKPGDQWFKTVYGYRYDQKGNVESITSWSGYNCSAGEAIVDSQKSQTFVYDALDRLSSATSGLYGSLAYSYDKIGNLTNKEGITYDRHDTKPHAVKHTSDGFDYIYDANGNMTFDGRRTINQGDWDFENRPLRVTYNGTTTEFLYDGNGNRVRKSGPHGTIVYIDNLYECSAGSCVKYIIANNRRIAMISQSQTLFYHGDHLGSSVLVTNQNGNTFEEVFYKPFGEEIRLSGTGSVNHRFTGQELDWETDLYYYNSRYYNQKLGRFISPDKFVPEPQNPQSLNRYSYCINNPVYYVDPSGDFFGAFFVGAAIGAFIGGSVSEIQGGDFWQGALTGAITGGFFGVASSYLTGLESSTSAAGLGVSTSFRAGTYSLAGAAAGVTNAAVLGQNVGQGALIGAGLGATSGFGVPQFAPFGNSWVGSIGNHIFNSALVGAAFGGSYSALTGGSFIEGAKTGAIGWAIGDVGNMVIGHGIGFFGQGISGYGWSLPEFRNGAFLYYGNKAAITLGNVIWGWPSIQSQPLFLTHELSHAFFQSTLLGPSYIPAHIIDKMSFSLSLEYFNLGGAPTYYDLYRPGERPKTWWGAR